MKVYIYIYSRGQTHAYLSSISLCISEMILCSTQLFLQFSDLVLQPVTTSRPSCSMHTHCMLHLACIKPSWTAFPTESRQLKAVKVWSQSASATPDHWKTYKSSGSRSTALISSSTQLNRLRIIQICFHNTYYVHLSRACICLQCSYDLHDICINGKESLRITVNFI